MIPKPTSRRPVGHQLPTPRRRGRAARTPSAPLPKERYGSVNATAVEPDPIIVQAKRDIDAGLVDTDMRATPGLDAARRTLLVPGPGGQPPVLLPRTLEEQNSDFTAEGSPPPGSVGTRVPAEAPAPDTPAPDTPKRRGRSAA